MKNATTEPVSGQDEKIPAVIGIRTDDYRREIRRWRKTNKRVPWSCLLRDALVNYFKKEAA